jgi:hypothetical protein
MRLKEINGQHQGGICGDVVNTGLYVGKRDDIVLKKDVDLRSEIGERSDASYEYENV